MKWKAKARYYQLDAFQQTSMNWVILTLIFFSIKPHLIHGKLQGSHHRPFMPCHICSDKKKVSQQFRMKKDNLDKLDQKDKLSRSNKASLTPLYLVIFSTISKKVFIKLSFLPD